MRHIQDFAIPQSTNRTVRVEHNSAGENGAEQRAPSYLIDACDTNEPKLAGLALISGETTDRPLAGRTRCLCATCSVFWLILAVAHNGAPKPLFALAKTRGFAPEPAKVVQLGAAHATGTNQIDMRHDRRIQRENAFDALAKADLANRDGFAHADVLAGNDGALKACNRSLSPSLIRTCTRIVSPVRNSGCAFWRCCLLMNLLSNAFCISLLFLFFACKLPDQIRPKPLSLFARCLTTPALDLRVIASQQHIGNFPTAELRRPRVLRTIQ